MVLEDVGGSTGESAGGAVKGWVVILQLSSKSDSFVSEFCIARS